MNLFLDCPNGWLQIQEKCYFFNKKNINWNKAAEYCKKNGAKLFEPRNLVTNELVFHAANNASQTWNGSFHKWVFFWIGIHDSRHEGKFSYASDSNGTEIPWSNFADNEPNNKGKKGEDCVQLRGNSLEGKWNDANCDDNSESICEASNVVNTMITSPSGHDYYTTTYSPG